MLKFQVWTFLNPSKSEKKYSSKKLNDGSFEVALHINNLLISKGYGRRKVEAEKNAAKDALNTYTKFLKDD